MKDNTMLKIIVIGFGVFVALPMAVGGALKLTAVAIDGISKVAYKAKIKKGLKDGSIIEVDGQYYEVNVEDVEKQ